MIRVRTGSRLHFGLFNAGSASSGRRFGGVGLMIDDPGIKLVAHPASEWSATGPLASRVLNFVEHLRSAWDGSPLQPLAFTIESTAPEHVGLGTGTQLGMAVARTIQLAMGRHETTAEELARLCGRGQRSALGVHGFLHGGFLVEGGQATAGKLSPLLVRLPWPDEWRILLVNPQRTPGIHGESERSAFRQLRDARSFDALTDQLCRLTLTGMIPALLERDLPAFGEALHEFNALAGAWFAPLQGGTYAGPTVEKVVAWLRQRDIRAVGQSSWGPTVFAVVEAAQEEELSREHCWDGSWQIKWTKAKRELRPTT